MLTLRNNDKLNLINREFDNALESMFQYGTNIKNSILDFTYTSNDDEIIIKGKVSGYSKKEIEVNIENKTLIISAENNEEKGLEGFSKKYTIPNSINTDNISAICENGLLQLVLPKSKPEVITKSIKVK